MKLSNALLLSSVVGVAVGQQTTKIKLKPGKTCVGEPDVFPNSTKKGQCKKKCMKKAGCKGIRFENRPKDGGKNCGHYMENDVKVRLPRYLFLINSFFERMILILSEIFS